MTAAEARPHRAPARGREEIADEARRLADGMRRDGRTCTRFERWLHVLDLHHRDPQLLTEVVLVLTDPPD